MNNVLIQKFIDREVNKQKGSKVSVYGRNQQSGKVFEHNAGMIFGTASIIKIAIALAMFEKAEKNKLDIDKPILLSKHKDVLNLDRYTNGALSYFPKNGSVSLRIACMFMLKLSDNPATNLVLKFVSQKEVNEYLKKKGHTYTKLTAQKIDPQKLESTNNFLGLTTAEEMTNIFEKVADGTILTKKTNVKDLQKMLEADYPTKTYNRFLPVTWNVPERQVKISTIYTKDGSFPKYELRTDSFSLITRKGDICSFSIFTKGIKNNGKSYPTNLSADHPATVLIGKIAKMVFDYLY